ncbi:unnamed protein product, partial [Effrenium voratum]
SDSHVPGTWYHVLSYPLFGDVTKALVRPARWWGPDQREAAAKYSERIGETLLSQIAKTG